MASRPFRALNVPLMTPLQRIWRSYLLQRLGKALLTIFIVTSLIFFMIRLMPGDPVETYVNELITRYGMTYVEARDQAAALFAIDLDAPLHVQYLGYLSQLLRGNMGTSILSPGVPVTAVIARFLPWTLFSVGLSLLISFSLGVTLGMVMAYRRESPLDHALSAFASILSSIPNYLVGIILLVYLGVQWNLVPIQFMRGSLSPGIQPGFTWTFMQDVLAHAALPVTTYVLTTIGAWMLTMKSSTISTLGEDYVTVARARGLPDHRITFAYIGRNAALPLFTQLAVTIGFVVGGAVLIERIFVYHGIGEILLRSIERRDYTVMQGVFIIITCAVILSNLMADYLCRWLDPRIQRPASE